MCTSLKILIRPSSCHLSSCVIESYTVKYHWHLLGVSHATPTDSTTDERDTPRFWTDFKVMTFSTTYTLRKQEAVLGHAVASEDATANEIRKMRSIRSSVRTVRCWPGWPDYHISRRGVMSCDRRSGAQILLPASEIIWRSLQRLALLETSSHSSYIHCPRHIHLLRTQPVKTQENQEIAIFSIRLPWSSCRPGGLAAGILWVVPEPCQGISNSVSHRILKVTLFLGESAGQSGNDQLFRLDHVTVYTPWKPILSIRVELVG